MAHDWEIMPALMVDGNSGIFVANSGLIMRWHRITGFEPIDRHTMALQKANSDRFLNFGHHGDPK